MTIQKHETQLTPEIGSYKRAVGVYKTQDDIEHVIRSLKDSGYDMNRVSLLARNLDDVEGADAVKHRDTTTEGNEASEGAGIGATTGTVLGGVTGFLIGVGLLAIPGVGPVLAAGAEIGALGSTLAGAGIGAAAGGIVGALVGLGIPEEKAKIYEERVKAGEYLLIVSGDDDMLNRAESIMRDRDVHEFEIFDAPDSRNVDSRDIDRNDSSYRKDYDTTRHRPTTTARDTDNDGEAEVIVTDNRDSSYRR